MTDIAGGIITLEFAQAGLKFTGVNVARDADLTSYVQAATAVIEDIVGPVLQATITRTFDGGRDAITVPHTFSAVASVYSWGVPLSGWVADADSAMIFAGTLGFFPEGVRNIQATYTVGYATIPATIKLATRELVRFWVQQGVQSQRPSFGDGVEAAAFTPQGFAVPKRVMELCAPFRRLGGFA